MTKKLFLLILGFHVCSVLIAQQLPLGTCGIVCTYDASGNRLKRVYFCNNGVDPYPSRAKLQEANAAAEAQLIDALYPNPTTGRFVVTFSKELKNASVILTDINGRQVQQFKGNGYQLQFDLSRLANGTYIVRINDNGLIITKKVVKQ